MRDTLTRPLRLKFTWPQPRTAGPMRPPVPNNDKRFFFGLVEALAYRTDSIAFGESKR